MTRGSAPATIGSLVPMVRCPRCRLPQYAATAYASRAACVRCDTPLQTPRAAPRARFLPFDLRIERTSVEERTAS
jgi:hypothetical protein